MKEDIEIVIFLKTLTNSWVLNVRLDRADER